MRVPGRGIEAEEAVAEDARRVVRDERVLAAPAPSVPRVVRVEIDEAAVAVGGRAGACRPEAVDGLAVIGETAEDVVEASAVDPVGPRLEPGKRPGPVRE